MTANVSKTMRKAIYKRDGYRCAVCDSADGLQIHHVVPRGKGGRSDKYNLITLCWRCHSMAHGFNPHTEWEGWSVEEMELNCIEYLADLYGPEFTENTVDYYD